MLSKTSAISLLGIVFTLQLMSSARAADAPAVKYIPLPMAVERQKVKSEIYLAAVVDEAPGKLADKAAQDPAYQVIAQIVAAAKKKDAAAYKPLSWWTETPQNEIEIIRGYRSISKVNDVTLALMVGDVRYVVLQQDEADRFLPIALQKRGNETKAVVNVLPVPALQLLHEYAANAWKHPEYAPVDKVNTTQQIDLPIFDKEPAGKVTLHFNGSPVVFQISKSPPATKAPEKLLPVLQFFQDHMMKLKNGDADGYMAQLGSESRKDMEQAIKEAGPDFFKNAGPMASFVDVKYVIETGDAYMLFIFATPTPPPDMPLRVVTIRAKPEGKGFERINEGAGGILQDVLESPAVTKQLLGAK